MEYSPKVFRQVAMVSELPLSKPLTSETPEVCSSSLHHLCPGGDSSPVPTATKTPLKAVRRWLRSGSSSLTCSCSTQSRLQDHHGGIQKSSCAKCQKLAQSLQMWRSHSQRGTQADTGLLPCQGEPSCRPLSLSPVFIQHHQHTRQWRRK